MAAISLVFSFLEIVCVWGVAAAAPATGEHRVLLKVISIVWISGSLLAIATAILALLTDRRRPAGAVSLAVAFLAFFICGLQILA